MYKIYILYKITCFYKQSFIRGVHQERCSANNYQTHKKTIMQKTEFKEIALWLYWNHGHAWVHPWKFAIHPQNTLLQENTSREQRLYVKRVLKDLNCKKVKNYSCWKKFINTHKKSKCPVIGPRSFRKVLRFSNWALLYWQ